MSLSVSQLRRPFSANEALESFRRGQFKDVLEQTRLGCSPDGRVLRARAQLRLQLPSEALRTIGTFDTSVLTDIERGEAALVRATAAARTGAFELAEEAISEARAFAFSTPHQSLEMDVDVTGATIAFMRGDLAGARSLIDAAFATSAAISVVAHTNVPFYDISNVRARALEIMAFIANASSDFEGNARHLDAAFDEITAASTQDVWLQANMAANCSMIARELGKCELIDKLRHWSAGFEWTEDLRLQRYHLERAFGMSAALSGDQLAAFRHYRRAMDLAPADAMRVVAMIDRVTLARSSPDTPLLMDELEAIRDAAEPINWGEERGEGYVTLLMLAQTFAPSDPQLAEGYLDQYRKLHARVSRQFTGHYDPRRGAHEAFANGLIAAARGEKEIALGAFDRAHATFVAASCPWRAALVSIERFALDRSTESKTLADGSLKQHRDAWFTRRYERLLAEAA